MLLSSTRNLMLLLFLVSISPAIAGNIALGSELSARTGQSWVSENGTFAFGFAAVNSDDELLLGIWYAGLPDDQNAVVWSPNRDSTVGKDAIVKLDQTGSLLLLDNNTVIWTSNTTGLGIQFAFLSDSGNFILSAGGNNPQPAWDSFSHPSDTLLPGQPLSASLELTSAKSSSGYYSLKMLQQQTSLSLALTYSPLLESNNNYSYWASPQISNATGEVVAMLDSSGNFAIMYGKSAAGTVYVHKNDSGSSSALRRIAIGADGNLHLYLWNSSSIWVSLWSAVSNPCQVAGICGGDICILDGNSSSGASCRKLPPVETNPGDCRGKKMETIPQTNYYFSGASTIANYSDMSVESECADHCESDCDCVASVYEIVEGENYCSTLSSMLFGGLQDPTSTLYMKVGMNQTFGESGEGGGRSEDRHFEIVLPLVFGFSALAVLLFLFLGFTVRRRKNLGEQMLPAYLTLPGAPLNFSYQDLQMATSNFSRFLGAGGFGSVYKGVLRDGTQVAVKKLERLLPHGEREFVTEVTTIGSMHHMNLVNLCGFCSERSHRLLVYEYMSNGSLDKWIFPSNNRQNRFLEWRTRMEIAVSIAQGIAYFHEQCKNRIIHCDIKPENILLDENFRPKVSDFGLAKLMSREHSHVITMVRGTRGYLAPEWVSNRPITVKADVYSYGMVLLEIIGGRRNLDVSLDEDQFFYPRLAFKEMTKETPMRAVDKRLKAETIEAEELVGALRTAFWCIQEDVATRPSMGEVVRMLEGSMEINAPPMPQSVLELVEEGLHRKRGFLFEPFSSSSAVQSRGVSQETFSHSTMSPR
ncbi:G-type lectin S-receptor-like serine/threonine-protein kinase [Platanthera zijinensis]|uniref:Receptor-like serine/threonine-protein kinase n=1 Tax=Platanthera zijinensis TaxID=2320716 RepID=A0AAP0BRY0_9ASPA